MDNDQVTLRQLIDHLQHQFDVYGDMDTTKPITKGLVV